MVFQCHSAVERRRAPGKRAEAGSYLEQQQKLIHRID